MLEYAVERVSGKFVHVDAVPNGKNCGCVCPECKDYLTAKNNCKDKSNHFAHQNLIEGRACLMTQLHLAAQHYFLNITHFLLPEVSIPYDGKVLTAPSKNVQVYKATLEAKIDKFSADILLHTDIGEVFIEIQVTHESEDNKINFYKDNEITSLELDFSKLKNLEVEPCISLLTNNAIPYVWHYSWCQRKVIENYLIKKRIDEERRLAENFKKSQAELKQRKESAKRSAKKFMNGKYVLLPSLNEEMQCTIDGIPFKENVQIFTKKEFKFDDIRISCDEESCLILECEKYSNELTHRLFVAYPYTTVLTEKILKLDGSVIIKKPPEAKNKHSTWLWYKAPKMSHRRTQLYRQFIEKCEIDAKKKSSTILAESQIRNLATNYANNSEFYFKAGYGKWKNWLIERGLFKPATNNRNPSIPSLLKYHRRHPNLWMFDSWHVLLISYIAEIIDEVPIKTRISPIDVFYQLSQLFPPKQEFYNLEEQVSRKFLDHEASSCIIRSNVISSVLDIFELDMKIIRDREGYKRIGSLVQSVSPGKPFNY
ncbi:hypothetical protein JYB88_11060 [Shewanella cyperi]|uniref:Competence protein n=1 Tax=Shewanella cyperi TaxID=2814292 RepID=A0A974XQS5_9GAMM|nr:hypothetical protein [Shewanella cyperi]QSX28809.1 hypothetical protein JYB88_11060 [Shewanella cyperi]